MNLSFPRIICCSLSCLILGLTASATGGDFLADKPESPKSRRFTLDYSVTISGPKAGTRVRVWLPEAQTTEDQEVTVLGRNFPVAFTTNTEPKFNNRIVFFEAEMPESGSLSGRISYRAERREVLGLPGEQVRGPMTLSEAERKLHLAPNKKIPLNGKSMQLLAGKELPDDQLARGRVFYNLVDDLVKYDKSRPGYGTGDSEWVCDSRYGNCTDFHSLFIAWARAHSLPARFEIGFPLPEKRGQGKIPGYHCWAFFYVDGHGWTPVDISEADKNPAMKDYYFGHLTEDRLTFTRGRDIKLVPRQASEPLNFFIYPHVEVDGQTLPKDQVQLSVSYRDE